MRYQGIALMHAGTAWAAGGYL